MSEYGERKSCAVGSARLSMIRLSYRKCVNIYIQVFVRKALTEAIFAIENTVRAPWRVGGRIAYEPRRPSPPSTKYKSRREWFCGSITARCMVQEFGFDA
jgi:hypothetical protein